MFPLPRSSTIWGYDTPVELLRLQLESKCASTVVVKPEGRRSAAAAVALIVVTKEDFLCQTFYYCTILESCFHGTLDESTHGEPAYSSCFQGEYYESTRTAFSQRKSAFWGLSFTPNNGLSRLHSPLESSRVNLSFWENQAQLSGHHRKVHGVQSPMLFTTANDIIILDKATFSLVEFWNEPQCGLVFLMSVMRQFFSSNLVQ